MGFTLIADDEELTLTVPAMDLLTPDERYVLPHQGGEIDYRRVGPYTRCDLIERAQVNGEIDLLRMTHLLLQAGILGWRGAYQQGRPVQWDPALVGRLPAAMTTLIRDALAAISPRHREGISSITYRRLAGDAMQTALHRATHRGIVNAQQLAIYSAAAGIVRWTNVHQGDQPVEWEPDLVAWLPEEFLALLQAPLHASVQQCQQEEQTLGN